MSSFSCRAEGAAAAMLPTKEKTVRKTIPQREKIERNRKSYLQPRQAREARHTRAGKSPRQKTQSFGPGLLRCSGLESSVPH